jgi:uncharacterized membrane protein
MEAQQKTLSINSAVRFGWETTKNHFKFYVGVLIAAGVIYYAPALVFETFDNIELPTATVVFFFIAGVVIYFVQLLVSMGLLDIALKFAKGAQPQFKELIGPLESAFSFIVGSIVYSIIVTFGFVLLIVPGVIWGVRFQYFQYLIIERKLGPIIALKMSWHMTKGYTWDLVLFWITLFGVNVLGVLALGVGLLVSIPTSMVANAWIYKKLRKS